VRAIARKPRLELRLAREQKTTITVMLADDHPIIRAGFASFLEAYGIKVVGEEGDPKLVAETFRKTKPDVLVLDIRFGDELNGLDIAADLVKNKEDIKIVFLSQFSQDWIVKKCYQIGGKAFLTKDCNPEELEQAIRNASEGRLYYTKKIAEQLATLSIHGEQAPQSILQERELEILKMMAKGKTIVEIADTLSLSQKTIANISLAIKEKLEINRPAEITRYAIRHGIIDA
jgi:two-component system, NarL family, invasion response regulator UvrY